MEANVVVGVIFVILAVSLFLLSLKGALGDGWLDRADKVASVVALLVAIVAFVNPFDRSDELKKTAVQSQQNISIGNNSQGNLVGQSNSGDVTIGDTSTSAKKRAEVAFVRIKAEVLNNFRTLALTIQAIVTHPPEKFWDVRRANETELAYQDRAKSEFRDYQKAISLYVNQANFSTHVFDSFQRDLSHDPALAEQIQEIYRQHREVMDSFYRLENGLQHLASLHLSDLPRTEKGLSFHNEMMLNAKVALANAGARFFSLAQDESDNALLSDALESGGIDIGAQSGVEGFRALTKLAAQFANEKVKVLAKRVDLDSQSSTREIERRVTDPYLLMLRKSTGLPVTLTEGEVYALQNKVIDQNEEQPEKLFELAAMSYLESDGHASRYYFRKAIETKKLAPSQQRFARLSIDRIERPQEYSGSIGVMIVKLTENGNFAKAGLNVGDVILSLNGQAINEPLDIASVLAKMSDAPVLLNILRDGEKVITKVQGGEPAGALVTQLIILNAIQL